MRLLILGLLISSALGCSTSKVSYEKPTTPPGMSYLKPGDREPAQAPELRWTPAVVKLNVSGNASAPVQQVVVNQEMTWTELVHDFDTVMQYRDFDVPGICSDFNCSGGAGKSAAWSEYRNAQSRDKKAAALAKAVQGVGEVSSKALVEKGYFRNIPASWHEFSSEIKRAGEAGVIRKSDATKIVDNYKYENIENLGYAAGKCQEVKTSCTVTISKLTPVRVPIQRKVEQKRIVQSRQFNVQVSVENAVLLKDETDRLTLSINENGDISSLDVDGYNRYALMNRSLMNQELKLNISGAGRILRQLPNNVIRQDSYTLVGNKPTFVLDIDSKYLPTVEEDPNSQLVVDYTVNVCEYGWTGTCGISSWKNLSMNSTVITGSRLMVTAEIPPKHKSEIVYTITRKNSRFFSDKATSSRSTENVKMARY